MKKSVMPPTATAPGSRPMRSPASRKNAATAGRPGYRSLGRSRGDDDEVLRRVPGILALRAEKALREEHGADDEHQRAGHLRGDENVLQPMAWKARLIARAERGAGVRPGGGERRNGAAREDHDQAAEKRDGQRPPRRGSLRPCAAARAARTPAAAESRRTRETHPPRSRPPRG